MDRKLLTPPIDTSTFVFKFGKHVGETYQQVVETDPQYIAWCYTNMDWFNLSKEDMEALNSIEMCDEHDEYEEYRLSDFYGDLH